MNYADDLAGDNKTIDDGTDREDPLAHGELAPEVKPPPVPHRPRLYAPPPQQAMPVPQPPPGKAQSEPPDAIGGRQPQQPPPTPFTQADLIQLQRLQQGLSSAQAEADKGEITQEQADHYKAEIQGRITPLMARQQQTRQQQEQQQQQQVLHANAQAQMVKTMNQQHNAQSFQQTVATYTDPATGHTVHLMPRHNGDWEEMKFEREKARDDRLFDNPPESGSLPPSVIAGAAGAENEDAGQAKGPGGSQGPAGTPWSPLPREGAVPRPGAGVQAGISKEPSAPPVPTEPGTAKDVSGPWDLPFSASAKGPGEEEPAGTPEQPHTLDQLAQRARQQARPPGEPQVITGGAVPRLGQDLSQFHWNPDTGKMEQEGWNNSPRNQSAERELLQRAAQAIGPPPTPTGHAAFDLHQQQLWRQRVTDLHHQMVARHYRHEEHQSMQQAAMQEHVRTEGARREDAVRKEQAAADEHRQQFQERLLKAQADRESKQHEERKTTEQQHLQGLRHYRDVLGKQRQQWLDKNLGKKEDDLPDYLKPENEASEAHKRHAEDLARVRGQPGPDSKALKDQADRVGQVLQAVGVGTAETKQEPLTTAEEQLPSSIRHDRVKELLPVVQAGRGVIGFNQQHGSLTQTTEYLDWHLQRLHGLLNKAHQEGRGLTVGERKRYEAEFDKANAILKRHGQDAEKLRLVPED